MRIVMTRFVVVPVPNNRPPLAPALLIARLFDRQHNERLSQVRVSGERVARLAFDQDVDPLDSRNVDGQRLHQRIYGELLAENAGAVLVGEGGIQIDDGRTRIDEVDAADVRGWSQRMRRSRLLVDAQQRAQQLFGSLLASSGK